MWKPSCIQYYGALIYETFPLGLLDPTSSNTLEVYYKNQWKGLKEEYLIVANKLTTTEWYHSEDSKP